LREVAARGGRERDPGVARRDAAPRPQPPRHNVLARAPDQPGRTPASIEVIVKGGHALSRARKAASRRGRDRSLYFDAGSLAPNRLYTLRALPSNTFTRSASLRRSAST